MKGTHAITNAHYKQIANDLFHVIESTRKKFPSLQIDPKTNRDWARDAGLERPQIIHIAEQHIGEIADKTWFCDFNDWTESICWNSPAPNSIVDSRQLAIDTTRGLQSANSSNLVLTYCFR